MRHAAKVALAVATVATTLVILDLLFLGVIARGYYAEALGPLMRPEADRTAAGRRRCRPMEQLRVVESAPVSKRSPKVPGIAATVVGGGAVAFSLYGLAIVGLQRIFFAAIHDPNAAAFTDAMRALHHVWLINLPWWIVLGAALAWQGLRLQRATPGAAESVAVLSLLGVVAFVLYALDCRGLVPVFEQQFARGRSPFPMSMQTWMDFSIMTCVLICGAVLGALAVVSWSCREGRSASQ